MFLLFGGLAVFFGWWFYTGWGFYGVPSPALFTALVISAGIAVAGLSWPQRE